MGRCSAQLRRGPGHEKKAGRQIHWIHRPISWATHAVIGTLRPTEQRRAMLCQSHNGAEGNRTPDLCSAIAALYQLSYSPDSVSALITGNVGASHSLLKLSTRARPVNYLGQRTGELRLHHKHLYPRRADRSIRHNYARFDSSLSRIPIRPRSAGVTVVVTHRTPDSTGG